MLYRAFTFLLFLVFVECRGDGLQNPTIQIQLALPQSLLKKQNDIQSDFARITKIRLSIATKPNPTEDSEYIIKQESYKVTNEVSQKLSLVPGIYYIVELKAFDNSTGNEPIFLAVSREGEPSLLNFVNEESILPVKFSMIKDERADSKITIQLLPRKLKETYITKFTGKKELKLKVSAISTAKFHLYCYYNDVVTNDARLSLSGYKNLAYRYIYRNVSLSD